MIFPQVPTSKPIATCLVIPTRNDMDFILRQQLTSDELPPWAGIVFKYPVDSDTLSEKLREAYPDCKTLRERKHRAAIDFLSAELSRMQAGNSNTDAICLDNFRFPAQEPAPDASKVRSNVLSEGSEILSASGCTSPSIVGSMLSPKLAERTRKESRATVNSEHSQPSASPSSAQQFVWSAHDGRSMRPKTKRKMTVEERSAYKETRKRGACDKCRRQKGRCTHLTDDSHWQPIRKSTEPDVPARDGSKSIKLEHASDVHHETMNRRVIECQPAISTNPVSPYQNVGPLPNEQHNDERANEYVQSQNLISAFTLQMAKNQGPWSTYATRNPSETALPDYVLDPDVTHSLSSPQTPVYGFQPDLTFYEGQWDPRQNQPSEYPPPG